ncbi:FAD:protein FMN transferase [Hyphococcus luteus]|nr:FAD:protein FMN transferase [Marinicaulis flavus]
MGTTWSVRFVAPESVDAGAVCEAVQHSLDRVVAEMSPWERYSDIARFNAAPAASWVEIPDAFMRVAKAAAAVAKETGGAYDPASGALVDLWGFGPAERRAAPPSGRDIDAALGRCGRALDTDEEAGRLFQPGGVKLDLCSIAKGFGVDEAGDALDALGIASWLVEVGGELKGRGVKPNGEPWWAALDADAAVEDAGFVIALYDLAVATSGSGVNFFDHGGRRYSHLLDPRTGYSAESGLSAVTVIHDSAMMADAYATAIFVMGPLDGFAFAEKQGLAVRLAGAGAGDERLTGALAAMLD